MATYENIRLEKGLYTTGKSFTQALEALDPSENYIGTPLEGLDAYQRQLKRFDIKVSGRGSDRVEKFFKTTDSAALFPEYVSRAVWAGVEENNLLPNIVATVTDIEGLDYRTLASTLSDEDSDAAHVIGEGEEIPTTNITTTEHLVKLKKRGRMLVASYEAIRFQRLDLFTVALRQIGAYIARRQLQDAVDVLMNGDGTGNNNAITTTSTAAAGTLTEIGYDTLRKFVLICPVSVNIPAVDGTRTRLEFDGDSFCVDHCEKVFFGETPQYYWAIVHQNNDWRVTL